MFGYPVLRSKPQRWIPELRFGYPPLKNFPKSFWENFGIFLESLGGSQRQLCIKTQPLKRSFTIKHSLCHTLLQQFPRVTSIGSLPPQTLGRSRGPPQSPAEPSERPPQNRRRDPAEPSERQISSESLAEGCAPRMVTLRNFRNYARLLPE